MVRGAKSPWRKRILFKGAWRCECSRIVSGKVKVCDKCGKERPDVKSSFTDQ